MIVFGLGFSFLVLILLVKLFKAIASVIIFSTIAIALIVFLHSLFFKFLVLVFIVSFIGAAINDFNKRKIK